MNVGTKIRTILAVIMLINEALLRIGTVDFGNETSNLIYRWVSFGFLVAAYVASHWYNNDFTEIASKYTADMREAKERLRAEDEEDGEDFDGEFLDGIEEEEGDE